MKNNKHNKPNTGKSKPLTYAEVKQKYPSLAKGLDRATAELASTANKPKKHDCGFFSDEGRFTYVIGKTPEDTAVYSPKGEKLSSIIKAALICDPNSDVVDRLELTIINPAIKLV